MFSFVGSIEQSSRSPHPRVNAQRLKREQEDIKTRKKKQISVRTTNTNHDGISNSINRRVSEDL